MQDLLSGEEILDLFRAVAAGTAEQHLAENKDRYEELDPEVRDGVSTLLADFKKESKLIHSMVERIVELLDNGDVLEVLAQHELPSFRLDELKRQIVEIDAKNGTGFSKERADKRKALVEQIEELEKKGTQTEQEPTTPTTALAQNIEERRAELKAGALLEKFCSKLFDRGCELSKTKLTEVKGRLQSQKAAEKDSGLVALIDRNREVSFLANNLTTIRGKLNSLEI